MSETTDREMANCVVETLECLCEDLEQKIRAKFDQGDPRWPPLKPSTVKHKKRIKKEKMLIVTGQMRGAVTHKVTVSGRTVSGEVGIWDQAVLEYAPSHEFGTKDGTIPERSFLRSTYDEEIDRLAEDANTILGDAVESFWMDRPVPKPK